MNFSSLSSRSLIGKLLRLPLKLIPSTQVVRVIQGPLRGAKWIAGSGPNGYWLGSYEMPKQLLFSHLLRSGDAVLDVGAHVGFYTLLASRRVGPKGLVWAVEPLPENLRVLRHHISINGVKNGLVSPVAVSDIDGKGYLQPAADSSMGFLTSAGGVEVITRTIDSLITGQRHNAVDLIKIDVEGAEVAVLKGAAGTLSQFRPIVFLATHGLNQAEDCIELLKGCGYRIYQMTFSIEEFVAVADGSWAASRLEDMERRGRTVKRVGP